MIKYIYKSVILLLVFVGAMFFFGHKMETDINDSGKSVDLIEESFPYMRLETQGQTINTLYGYSEPIESNIVRESVTPLAADKKITLLLSKAESPLIKLQYQIIDKESGEIYDTKSINAISGQQRKIDIIFDYNFKTSTEYILDIDRKSVV